MEAQRQVFSQIDHPLEKYYETEPKRLFKLSNSSDQTELVKQFAQVQKGEENVQSSTPTPKSNHRDNSFQTQRKSSSHGQVNPASQSTSRNKDSTNTKASQPDLSQIVFYTQSTEGNFQETLEQLPVLDNNQAQNGIQNPPQSSALESQSTRNGLTSLNTRNGVGMRGLSTELSHKDSLISKEHQIVARGNKGNQNKANQLALSPREENSEQQLSREQSQIKTIKSIMSNRSSAKLTSNQLVKQQSIPEQDTFVGQSGLSSRRSSLKMEGGQIILTGRSRNSDKKYTKQNTTLTSTLSGADEMIDESVRSGDGLGRKSSNYSELERLAEYSTKTSQQIYTKNQFNMNSTNELLTELSNSHSRRMGEDSNSGVRKSSHLPPGVEECFSKDNAYDNLVFESQNEDHDRKSQILQRDDDDDQMLNETMDTDPSNGLQDLLRAPANAILNTQNRRALQNMDSEFTSQVHDSYSKKPIMTYNTFNQVVDRLINGFNNPRTGTLDLNNESYFNSTKSLDLPLKMPNSIEANKDTLQNLYVNSNSRQLHSSGNPGRNSFDQEKSGSLTRAQQRNHNPLDFSGSLNGNSDVKLHQNMSDTLRGYMDTEHEHEYLKDTNANQFMGSVKTSQTKLPLSSNPDYSHFFSGANQNHAGALSGGISTNYSSSETLNRILQQQRSGSIRSLGRQPSHITSRDHKTLANLQALVNNGSLNRNAQPISSTNSNPSGSSTNLWWLKKNDQEGRLTPMSEEASKQTAVEPSPRDINDSDLSQSYLNKVMQTSNEFELTNEVEHVDLGGEKIMSVMSTEVPVPASTRKASPTGGRDSRKEQGDKGSRVHVPLVSAMNGKNKGGLVNQLFRQDTSKSSDKSKRKLSAQEIQFRQQMHQKVERTREAFENMSEFQEDLDLDHDVDESDVKAKQLEGQYEQEERLKKKQLIEQGLLYNSTLGDTLLELKSFQIDDSTQSKTKKAWQQDGVVNFASYDYSRMPNFDLPSARKIEVDRSTGGISVSIHQPLSQGNTRKVKGDISNSIKDIKNIQKGGPSRQGLFRNEDLGRTSKRWQQIEQEREKEEEQQGKKQNKGASVRGPSDQLFGHAKSHNDLRQRKGKRNIGDEKPQTEMNLHFNSKQYKNSTSNKFFKGYQQNGYADMFDENLRTNENGTYQAHFENQIQEMSGNRATQLDFQIEDNTSKLDKKAAFLENFELPSYSEMIAIDKS